MFSEALEPGDAGGIGDAATQRAVLEEKMKQLIAQSDVLYFGQNVETQNMRDGPVGLVQGDCGSVSRATKRLECGCSL